MTDREKIIYDILCSDEQPPEGQHWEGFVTNKIVAALAQPEPEAVAAAKALRHAAQVVQLYDDACLHGDYMIDSNDCEKILTALAEYYEAGRTAPPQREWVDLTAAEVKILRNASNNDREFAALVIARFKEKNT